MKKDKKLKSLPKLKKEAWKWFSVYIRKRDKGICFTCTKPIPNYYDRYGNLHPGWKAAQAGHWITAANCGARLYFHEKNVHCQCYNCNINLSGNWLVYETRIISVYGQKVCDELKRLKWQDNIEYTREDYLEMIDKYKKLANEKGE